VPILDEKNVAATFSMTKQAATLLSLETFVMYIKDHQIERPDDYENSPFKEFLPDAKDPANTPLYVTFGFSADAAVVGYNGSTGLAIAHTACGLKIYELGDHLGDSPYLFLLIMLVVGPDNYQTMRTAGLACIKEFTDLYKNPRHISTVTLKLTDGNEKSFDLYARAFGTLLVDGCAARDMCGRNPSYRQMHRPVCITIQLPACLPLLSFHCLTHTGCLAVWLTLTASHCLAN
jgi:hypothetical protein